jgi:hypothetical protein
LLEEPKQEDETSKDQRKERHHASAIQGGVFNFFINAIKLLAIEIFCLAWWFKPE